MSEARNLGLDFATSEYIIFIDSDDWIEPTYVEVLYEKIEEYQADIVFENYTSFNDEDSNFYLHMSNDYYEEIYDNSVISCFIFLTNGTRIIRRTIIHNNDFELIKSLS